MASLSALSFHIPMRARLLGCTAMLSVMQALTLPALAGTPAPGTLPTGGQVQSGAAAISSAGPVMTVTQSTDKAIISWQQFNVGAGATVNFQQPSGSAMTLNRVRGGDPSLIDGAIKAPGTVILVNPGGVVFGGGATVDVGGLVASTMDIADEDFQKGRLVFNRGSATGSVVNEGTIAARHGSVVLLASQIRNMGLIQAQLGSVVLAAGETVTLTPDGGAPMKVDPATVAAQIEAGGIIRAPGGAVYLTAQALNVLAGGVIKATGVIEADSLTREGGKLVLDAGGPITLQGATLSAKGATGGGTVTVGTAETASVTMDAASRIDASATETGKGGSVTVNSQDTAAHGVLLARGGALWGDGGAIETSGHTLAFDGVTVDVGAPKGKGGTWLLDPVDLTVNAAYAAAIQTALASGSVTLQTTNTSVGYTGVTAGGVTKASGLGDIAVNAGITWTSANSLTLDAYHGVSINAALSGTSLVVLTNDGGSGGVFRVTAPVSLTTSLTVNSTAYTLVTSAAALAAITGSGNYALTSDLALTGAWTPIGYSATGNNASPTAFTGTLEGLGHTITGLTVDAAGGGAGNLGLLSVIGGGGLVQNLTLSGGKLFGGTGGNLGLLAGQNQGTVRNVTASGTVTAGDGGSAVGGLIGSNSGTVTASSAAVAVSVGSGVSKVGGLVGAQTAGLIANSSVTGAVTAGSAATAVGGLAGWVGGGTVSGSYADSSLTVGDGGNRVGGLIGYGDAVITQSYANETISAGGGVQYVGGLLGYGDTANTVSAVYAVAPISVGTASDSVGGLAGYNAGTISAAYATGSITAGAGTTNIGGFVGSNAGMVTVGFWDTATSGLSVAYGSNTGTVSATAIAANTLTTATYVGFDFSNDWYEVDGRTRPFLRSEYATTITNTHQLQLMGMDTTASYVLAKNLDMSGTTVQGGLWSTSGFTPIGFTTVGGNASPTVFTGSLDGQGYTISNLTLRATTSHGVGLFSSIGPAGSVANLGLVNGTMINSSAGTQVTGWGMLAGKFSGTVTNSYATGVVFVSKTTGVGGLVGYMSGGTI
ncbi:filamentous hemagglutinin N-terminal domain-containing protein, partial [Azospirillum sp. B4]|uniref:filamentous hemagglutinin N-terminal domain-containing protein n=1 Tax=Azospirillum sp. B4 TaxID=95605 RepID=UPI00131F082E